MIDLIALEAFFYVYSFKGFIRAAEEMHRSQPTVSEHIKRLEAQVGRLFVRKPFAPTPLADLLYQKIAQPAFEGLAEFMRRIRAQSDPQICIAASEFILERYLVPLLALIKRAYPALRVTLKAGPRHEIEQWLKDKSVDLAIVAVDAPPTHCQWQPLLTLPVVLLVPAECGVTNMETFLTQPPPDLGLTCPPPGEGASRRFDGLLCDRRRHLPITIVASSTAQVPVIVATSQTAGVCVGVSTLLERPGIRALPLAGVEPVTVGVLSRDEITPPLRALLELIGQTARRLASSPEFGGVGDSNGPNIQQKRKKRADSRP